MIRITIPFLRHFEEQLAGNVQKLSELEKLCKEVAVHASKIIAVLKVLEKHGWKWETSYNDVILFKPHFFAMTKADALAELKRLDIDTSIVEIEVVK